MDQSAPAMTPPVSMSPEAATVRENLEHATAQALINAAPADTDMRQRASDYKTLRSGLPAYSTDTLHRFASAATNTSIGNELLDRLRKGKNTEDFLNDWITVEPLAKSIGFWSELAIRGFSVYEHLEPFHPERRAEQAMAIIRVTAHLESHGKGINTTVGHNGNTIEHIKSQQLRELITTHENPAAVADIITTRDITDLRQITAILDAMDSIPAALTEGLL